MYAVAPGHSLNALSGSTPEISINPELGDRTPRIKSTSVVLPAPELPEIAICCPGETIKSIFDKLK